ncbi:hypothetical protein HAX54_001846 [Datura stramonium]|uniref:Uncharacterized protein n=1 Tax=Datura stramonium TaxID=4076 RepID=A0ABS8T3P3_DATST|nr:hypothetical protein [Datura stramonium]
MNDVAQIAWCSTNQLQDHIGLLSIKALPANSEYGETEGAGKRKMIMTETEILSERSEPDFNKLNNIEEADSEGEEDVTEFPEDQLVIFEWASCGG